MLAKIRSQLTKKFQTKFSTTPLYTNQSHIIKYHNNISHNVHQQQPRQQLLSHQQYTKSSSSLFPNMIKTQQHHHSKYYHYFPSRRTTTLLLTTASLTTASYSPLHELIENNPLYNGQTPAQSALIKEKTLDEWLEADAVLKLNHIRRRALLEEQVLNDVRSQMSYQEQKNLQEQLLHTGNNNNYQPNDTSILNENGQLQIKKDANNNPLGLDLENARGILTPDEVKYLEKWSQERDVHHIVINYLIDDIANYIKSFWEDDLSIVIDQCIQYLPPLIPHYIIGPYILNFIYSFIPTMPIEMKTLLPSIITIPLNITRKLIRSGNILIDLRCLYNLSIVFNALLSYSLYELTDKYTSLYKYCGYYTLYPFGWFLHHYGDKALETHIIRCSMKQEEKTRLRLFQKKYGFTPSTPITTSHDISSSTTTNNNNNTNNSLSFTSPSDFTTTQQPKSFINQLNPNGPRTTTPGGLSV